MYLATGVRSVVALVVSLPELILSGPVAIAAGAICIVVWIAIARDMRKR